MAPFGSWAERIHSLALSASAGVSLETGLGAFAAPALFVADAPVVLATVSVATARERATVRARRFILVSSGHSGWHHRELQNVTGRPRPQAQIHREGAVA